jgi:hypothetical protein
MKVVCAWCGASLPDKEPLADAETTHVICLACARRSPWAQQIATASARGARFFPGATAMTPSGPAVPEGRCRRPWTRPARAPAVTRPTPSRRRGLATVTPPPPTSAGPRDDGSTGGAEYAF